MKLSRRQFVQTSALASMCGTFSRAIEGSHEVSKEPVQQDIAVVGTDTPALLTAYFLMQMGVGYDHFTSARDSEALPENHSNMYTVSPFSRRIFKDLSLELEPVLSRERRFHFRLSLDCKPADIFTSFLWQANEACSQIMHSEYNHSEWIYEHDTVRSLLNCHTHSIVSGAINGFLLLQTGNLEVPVCNAGRFLSPFISQFNPREYCPTIVPLRIIGGETALRKKLLKEIDPPKDLVIPLSQGVLKKSDGSTLQHPWCVMTNHHCGSGMKVYEFERRIRPDQVYNFSGLLGWSSIDNRIAAYTYVRNPLQNDGDPILVLRVSDFVGGRDSIIKFGELISIGSEHVGLPKEIQFPMVRPTIIAPTTLSGRQDMMTKKGSSIVYVGHNVSTGSLGLDGDVDTAFQAAKMISELT